MSDTVDPANTVIKNGLCTFTALKFPIPVEMQHRLRACADDYKLLLAVEKSLRRDIGVQYSRPEFKPSKITLPWEPAA